LRVTVTGATGLIGPALVAALKDGGAQVTVLSRNPDRARVELGVEDAVRWDLMSEPAPIEALLGRDAVVHLAGENVAQRWTPRAKEAIRESRVRGTRHLVEGLRAAAGTSAAIAGERPRRAGALISASAIGYYGPHADQPIDEEASPGDDFLAAVCAAWESEARVAEQLGLRTVQVRTGVVLDRSGGALGKMLAPFKLGVGGPVAGGQQYISWIHRDDLVSMILAAVEDERWSGPINATAPEPVTNRDFSHTLGEALHRPALLPVPGFALRLLYGEMAEIITTGARALPVKPLVLGYKFRHPQLEEALRDTLG
jgi:uncharacterized protein